MANANMPSDITPAQPFPTPTFSSDSDSSSPAGSQSSSQQELPLFNSPGRHAIRLDVAYVRMPDRDAYVAISCDDPSTPGAFIVLCRIWHLLSSYPIEATVLVEKDNTFVAPEYIRPGVFSIFLLDRSTRIRHGVIEHCDFRGSPLTTASDSDVEMPIKRRHADDNDVASFSSVPTAAPINAPITSQDLPHSGA